MALGVGEIWSTHALPQGPISLQLFLLWLLWLRPLPRDSRPPPEWVTRCLPFVSPLIHFNTWR